jgi:hypothetical protein
MIHGQLFKVRRKLRKVLIVLIFLLTSTIALASICISNESNFDARGYDTNHEFIVIINNESNAVDMTNWYLSDEGPIHTFEFNYKKIKSGWNLTLPRNWKLIIFTGVGDNSIKNNTVEIHWNLKSQVWNNMDNPKHPYDTAYLYDDTKKLVSTYTTRLDKDKPSQWCCSDCY